jgi:hypothetical protein
MEVEVKVFKVVGVCTFVQLFNGLYLPSAASLLIFA